MTKFVQNAVVFHQFLCHACGDRDLIGKPPAGDGRMMHALHDQFGHLTYRVFLSFRQMFRNVWNFCPYDHAVFVAQVIEVLVMLIMRQADGIGPHLFYDLHILPVHVRSQRISRAPPVLMPGNAPKRIAFSI